MDSAPVYTTLHLLLQIFRVTKAQAKKKTSIKVAIQKWVIIDMATKHIGKTNAYRTYRRVCLSAAVQITALIFPGARDINVLYHLVVDLKYWNKIAF